MPAGPAASETLLFMPQWQSQPAAPMAAAETVIAFGDDAACRTFAPGLRRLVQVEPGSTFVRHSADRFTIDPARPEDYRRLLDEATYVPQPDGMMLVMVKREPAAKVIGRESAP